MGSEKKGETGTSFSLARLAEDEQGDGRPPTQHELDTLRKVAGKIPWTAYIICVVECESRRTEEREARELIWIRVWSFVGRVFRWQSRR